MNSISLARFFYRASAYIACRARCFANSVTYVCPSVRPSVSTCTAEYTCYYSVQLQTASDKMSITTDEYSGRGSSELHIATEAVRLHLQAANIALPIYSSRERSLSLRLQRRYCLTRSSADNRRDAFSGQSRSTNTVPFHILGIVSYCAITTLSFRRALLRYSTSENVRTLKSGSEVTQVIESSNLR